MSGRPASLAQMRERMKGLFSPESHQAGLTLRLRPTDVVITPYGKSGTTWTQQIVHTLRTRGDMDFDDISRVVPWIETSHDLGLDLDAQQKAEPRAFKSHLGWDEVPKGGRYITVVRDPGDVLVSMFKFNEGWFWEPGSVDIDEYARADFLERRNYYKHLRSWWPRRNDTDVLFLVYEKMLDDQTRTIERIAQFIGVELDPQLLALTEEHASFDFMLRYKDRFDDALIRTLSEQRCGLPEGSDSAKVRAGKTGSKVALGKDTHDALDIVWHEEITQTLGYPDYPSLVADVTG